jgi:hypothetical protein
MKLAPPKHPIELERKKAISESESQHLVFHRVYFALKTFGLIRAILTFTIFFLFVCQQLMINNYCKLWFQKFYLFNMKKYS